MDPIPIDVEAGRTYWLCRCGLSCGQPFCDGSHKGGDFSPAKFTADADGRVWFSPLTRALVSPPVG